MNYIFLGKCESLLPSKNRQSIQKGKLSFAHSHFTIWKCSNFEHLGLRAVQTQGG